jgi:hypothetical protein
VDGFDTIESAVEAWCKIHDCDVESHFGLGITAAAIDLYNGGYQSRERLTLALLAQIPNREAADQADVWRTVH